MSFQFAQPFVGLSSGLQVKNISGGAIGGWVELGRTTLGSAGDSITVGSLANKRYYMVLSNLFATGGNINGRYVLNADTGANYATRISTDGGADATVTSGNNDLFVSPAAANPIFSVGYFSNYSTKEKLAITHSCLRSTAGAGTAPSRAEHAGKHAQTTNPITSIEAYNGSTGDFNTGSEVVVLGYDPADTHTTNFWEELASVNASGSSTNLSSGTITAKKYLWVQAWLKNSTSHTTAMTFNNDTTTYAYRLSDNGAADSTSTSQADISLYSATTTPIFVNMFIINNSANEKLVIGHTINQNTAGAATEPNRRQFVGKYDNTAAQITEIDLDSSSGNWDSSSIIKVWGAN